MSQMPPLDFNNTIAKTMTKLTEENYVGQVIEKHMKKTIDDIVESSLRSHSDFGKGLKELVQAQLQINLEELDLPSYNELIIQTIKSGVERSLHEMGVAKMTEQLEEILGTKKETINFSEILKEMAESDCDLEELEYEDIHEITVHDDSGSRTLKFIYFDPEEDKESYQCKYRLVLNSDGTVSSFRIRDKEFNHKEIMGGLYGVEAMIFKAYTHGTKIIMDDYETEFSNPQYD